MEHRSIACKAKLQSHELMLQQMASFECRAAECIIEAGRVLVEAAGPDTFQVARNSRAPSSMHRSALGIIHYIPS